MGYEKKPYRKWNSAYKKDEKPVYKPKRGELKPLMSEEEKASAKVEDLAYDFACRMTRLYQWGTEGSREFGNSDQGNSGIRDQIPYIPRSLNPYFPKYSVLVLP